MKETAYLVMCWELRDCADGKIPLFVGCAILSDKYPTTRSNRFFTTILEIQGKTFSDARNKMDAYLNSPENVYHTWVLPWLEKNGR